MKSITNRRFDDSDDEDVLARTLKRRKQDSQKNDAENDAFGGLSLGSLSSAQKQMYQDQSQHDSDDTNDNHKSSHKPQHKHKPAKGPQQKKKHKHAPTETSSKKPVSRIRNLSDVVTPKYAGTLHQDLRFDAAYGKADLREARKNYAFLDDYRQSEINELQALIKDRKSFGMLSIREQNDARDRLQSLKSRLDTLKNRDLEHKILDDYKKEQMQNFRDGKQSNPYFLKRSEQRKLIQTAKFESMKPVQREKVMERKRKRKLGREFKQMEF
ncbi:rRNA biogenesis protein rrp36 [Yamadazyma tenuis]|nr:DUF947-domain-containing protein [Yamadazyma tenuis ATCC 10573]EGV62355.1 DUF947-domain-containing protein [Yamadazyma tenuis ATCC 10573]WEJ93622.1 rRNA biogenesis protein rrp36 [Yamadazyma tenuis]